eukprot:TRINITY_DN2733_c1_g1_i2.p1 TRINITY_DN2733_c1_g1~~TRINITY_DN2733_c1_g1_i2.p1  ORF type:complete len:534 (+),score=197.53 TRINITY_DN2733_c1_g1_i2:206-1807(+)
MAEERDVPPLPRVPTAIRETLLAPAPELPRYPTVIRGSMPEGAAAGAATAASDAAVRIGAAPPKFPSLMDVGVGHAQAAANALPGAAGVGVPTDVPPVPKFPSLTDVGVGPAQAAADAMAAAPPGAPMSPIAESSFSGRPSDVSMRSDMEPSFASTEVPRDSDVFDDGEGSHEPGDHIIETDGEASSSDVEIDDEGDVVVDDEDEEEVEEETVVDDTSRAPLAAAVGAAAAAGAVAAGLVSSGNEEEEDYDDEPVSSEYTMSRDGRSLASSSMRMLDTDDEGKILGDPTGMEETTAAIAASGVASARAVEARLAALALADEVHSESAATRATRFSGLPSETDSSSVNESEMDPSLGSDDPDAATLLRGVPRVGDDGDGDADSSDNSESTSGTDGAAAAAVEADDEPSTGVAAAAAAGLAGAAVLGTHVASREARITDEDGLSRVRSTTIETETVTAPGPDGSTVVASTSTFTSRPGEAPPPPMRGRATRPRRGRRPRSPVRPLSCRRHRRRRRRPPPRRPPPTRQRCCPALPP